MRRRDAVPEAEVDIQRGRIQRVQIVTAARIRAPEGTNPDGYDPDLGMQEIEEVDRMLYRHVHILDYGLRTWGICLQRLDAWWTETPRVATRTSRFAALAAA